MSGILYIISAPSGSGKTTLTNELLKLVPHLEFSVSYTTRPPRGSERNGHEYFFVSKEEFEEMINRGEFLEHANVFGYYYGTARRYLHIAEEHGNDLLLDIDVQGAQQVKQAMPEAVSIFIMPPHRNVLEKRLRNRSHAEHMDSEEVIQRRLAAAAKEIENYCKYDYILVNDRLDESTDKLKAIVSAERLRRLERTLSPAEMKVLSLADSCLLRNVRERVQPIVASFVSPAST